MASVDPWEMATECGRAVQTVTDPQRRAILTNLQDLWIALANESSMRSRFLAAPSVCRKLTAHQS